MAEGIALPEENQRVPVLFSHDLVLFPHMEVTIPITEKRSADAVLRALREHHLVAFIPADFERTSEGIGTLSLVTGSQPTQGGVQVDLKGLWRVRVMNPNGLDSDQVVQIERAEDYEDGRAGDPTVIRRVHDQIEEFSGILTDIPPEIVSLLQSARTSSELSDLCAMSPALTHQERITLLRTVDPDERLKMITRHLDKQLEMLRAMADSKPIPDCPTCTDLSDKAFDADPAERGEMIVEFLNHVVTNHTAELLGILAEKYGPIFMKRRSLR
jgi:ATP-dependent Lon protease